MERLQEVGFLLLGIAAVIGAISWSYKEIGYMHLNMWHYEECE